jgi:hypothetical protein
LDIQGKGDIHIPYLGFFSKGFLLVGRFLDHREVSKSRYFWFFKKNFIKIKENSNMRHFGILKGHANAHISNPTNPSH